MEFRARIRPRRLAGPWPDGTRGRRLRRAGAAALAALPALALGACVPGETPLLGAATETVRPLAEYTLAPRQASWSAQAGALLVLQRDTPAGWQQIVALGNDSAVKGDNHLTLIAYGSSGAVPKRFGLDGVMARIEGISEPFGGLTDSDLLQRRDRLGPFLVAERAVGGGTTCVLAIRRLTERSRLLPAGTAGMEVVLRNCVLGTGREALAPFSPERLAVGFAAADPARGVHPRVVNPLAAPEQ